MPTVDRELLRRALDELYERYNNRDFVHPDPLEFLYAYDNVRAREIAGLVASSLAYGRVQQILKSVALVLDAMGDPVDFVANATKGQMSSAFAGFRHRFTTGEEIARMLWGARGMIRRCGSLEAGLAEGMRGEAGNVLPALARFAAELSGECRACGSLVASPADGSACKRMNLFLRWMVRRDAVDPGGWDSIPASKLVVPLDTHMFRIAGALGFTMRKSADLKAAVEITEAFREFAPEDPVKYDFALTRLGIRRDDDTGHFFETLGITETA